MGPTHPIDHRVKVTRGLLERRNAGTLQSPFTLPARPGHLGSLSDSSRAAEVRPNRPTHHGAKLVTSPASVRNSAGNEGFPPASSFHFKIIPPCIPRLSWRGATADYDPGIS